jgi:hypothetical protein
MTQSQLDARTNAIYNSMLSEVEFAMETAEEAIHNGANAARNLADSLQGSEAYERAKERLQTLMKGLREVGQKQRDRAKVTLTRANQALTRLARESADRLQGAREDYARRRVEQAYEHRVEEEKRRFRQKSLHLYEEYVHTSKMLNQSAVREIQGYRDETVSSQIEALNKSIQDLDTIEKEQREKEAEEDKVEAAKTKKQKQEEKIENLRKEIARLNHSFLRRKTVDPIVDAINKSFKDTVQKIKDRTGITAVSKFLASEKQRKQDIVSKTKELQKLSLSAARTNLVAQRSNLQAEVVRRGGPANFTPPSTSPLSQPPATGGPSYTAPLTRPDDPQPQSPYRNIYRNARNNQSSYLDAGQRMNEGREIRALESIATLARNLARRVRPSDGSGSGSIMDWFRNPWMAGLLGVAGSLVTGLAAKLAKGAWNGIKSIYNTIKAAIKESDAYKYLEGKMEELKKLTGEKWDTMKKFFGEKWASVEEFTAKVGDFFKSKFGWEGSAAQKVVGNVTKAVRGGATAVRGAVSGVSASRIGTAALNLAGRAGEAITTGARAVGGAVGDGLSAVGKGAEWVASKGVNTLRSAASTLASNPRVASLMKIANKAGWVATAIGTVMGIYEEAEGKTVDSLSVMDAILNPMDAGRFLGNKFNKKFEEMMGTSFGSWIYDQVNGDPGSKIDYISAQALSSSGTSPRAMGRGGPMQNTRNARMSTPSEQQAPSPGPNGVSQPGPTAAPRTGTQSQIPALNVSGIPMFADPSSALMMYNAFGS